MGRLPKIVLLIIAMSAFFLWTMNSCGDKESPLDESVDMVGEIIDDTDEFVDDIGEDIFEDDDLFEDSSDFVDDGYIDEEEAVDIDFTSDEPEEISYTSSTSRSSYTSSEGDYMVIAGNYLVESNARGMTRKLSNLGYPNAEIGVFDRSQYHTVIASRHGSYSAALKVSNAIKRQGIECYVKRKQY